jgi:ubiquitin C
MHFSRQHLVFASKQLEDGGTPANYNMKEASTPHWMRHLHQGMRIFIKTLTGKTVTLDAELSDTIDEIKDMVKDSYGVNP